MLQRSLQLQAEGGRHFLDCRPLDPGGKLKVRDFAPERQFERKKLVRALRPETEWLTEDTCQAKRQVAGDLEEIATAPKPGVCSGHERDLVHPQPGRELENRTGTLQKNLRTINLA